MVVSSRGKPLLPSHRHEQGRNRTTQILVLLTLLLSCSNLFWIWRQIDDSNVQVPWRSIRRLASSNAIDTLVIYSFRYTDAETLSNMLFFMRTAVKLDDGARYIIAMDSLIPEQELPELPSLPPNAELITVPNCFEAGMAGWILNTSGKVVSQDYRYFLFISSQMRGPFLPAYFDKPWHTVLSDKINENVKLVGSTILCTSLIFDAAQGAIDHPHVQSEVMATDQVGLDLILKAGSLDCHSRWIDNLRYAEFGGSNAILKAGFTLDCLMLRYQAVNWKDKESWKCNSRMEPTRPRTYDGTSLNPLEVMFIKSDLASLTVQEPVVSQAALYSTWIEAKQKQRDLFIGGNDWVLESAKNFEAVMAQPAPCFDHEFYIMVSPVEFMGFNPTEAYTHFKTFGYKEGRPYRFLC